MNPQTPNNLSAGTFSGEENVSHAPEPFVSLREAAAFLGKIRPRMLQEMARKGLRGAYPVGSGGFRKKWVFRLSEVADAIDPKRYDPERQSPLK
jgi:hypothetical protein